MSGVARPNISAFESGRREPRRHTAALTLEATGATIDIAQPVTWSWTNGRCPYAVPSALWRLPIDLTFRVLTPGFHLRWSGLPPASTSPTAANVPAPTSSSFAKARQTASNRTLTEQCRSIRGPTWSCLRNCAKHGNH